MKVEALLLKALQKLTLPSTPGSNRVLPKLQLIWGSSLYHRDDLPFDASNIPDVYTQFRKAMPSIGLSIHC